jgi:hypothetical protein
VGLVTRTKDNKIKDDRLIEWTYSSSISVDKPNNIKIIVKGGYFIFYINGNYVGKVSDTRIKKGQVGLIATSPTHKGDECVLVFDDFKVRQS